MKVILLDKRNRFRDDVRTRLLLDDERDIELVSDLADSNNLNSAISQYHPDLIVVADNVYPERSTWSTCGVPVVAYITTNLGGDIFTCDGIPHYPQIASSTHLLNLLEAGIPSITPAHHQPAIPAQAPSNGQQMQIRPEFEPQNAPRPHHELNIQERPAMHGQHVADNGVSPSNQSQGAAIQHPYSSAVSPMMRTTAEKRELPAYPYEAPSTAPQPVGFSAPQATHSEPSVYEAQPMGNPPAHYGAPFNAKAELDIRRSERTAATYTDAVLEDIAVKNTTTKTVAVYSAKGGVGKTTITTELATILSMTSNGRGNYRVCLIDYNVDFGDILTTLNLDNRGPNLTHWAADVRRRMQNGEDPDSIYYGKKEIEGRLQRVGSSTLYALVAPVTHEDSMDIRSEEPGVILRNIIENGCFDFVVCDTGNNTRDATVSALDAADVIFMIATQDVSAVNCDKSFLQTMHRVGFDVDKIRLIMNGIMPYKYTQVSVEEVEAMFPYPCIARFKRDPEVTRANNCSTPIVKNPNHEFTKEMRKVVAYLTGRPIPQDKPKSGLFSIFKKKE